MHSSFKHPSFSFYQKMFDFIVKELRSRFFTGKMAAEEFTNGMLTLTDISVKFYNLNTQNVIILSRDEFDILENAYKAMKEDIESIKPESEVDHLLLQSTVSAYEQSFEIWKNHIHIAD